MTRLANASGYQRRGTLYGNRDDGHRSRHVSSDMSIANRSQRSTEDWRYWTEIKLKCEGLLPAVSMEALHKAFRNYGNISSIQIFNRSGKALIIFCPPPTEEFWPNFWKKNSTLGAVRVILELPKNNFRHPSPVHPGKTYDEHLALELTSLDFGFMIDPQRMMVMQTIEDGLAFRLDLPRSELTLFFNLPATAAAPTSSPKGMENIWHYKIQISFQQLNTIYEMNGDGNRLALIFTTNKPPAYFRQLENIGKTFSNHTGIWREWTTWSRQTDIVSSATRNAIERTAISLRNLDPIIDIGRWTTFRLTLCKDTLHPRIFSQIRDALSDYNIVIESRHIDLAGRAAASAWDMIDSSSPESSSRLLEDMFNHTHLDWVLRYQLEVCISQGCLNEYNISENFISRLVEIPLRRALATLEYAVDQKQTFHNPMDIFSLELPDTTTATTRKLPKHCSLSRTATITPSTLYYSSPTTDMSNRILRQYKEHEDRFLRVRFTDEEERINWCSDDTQDPVFTRVYRCLLNGIRIGNRHYEFLAMGNSQFREHGAYFFAPIPSLSAAEIRARMGNFDEIRTVAKWAARLGQCFSTTRAVRSVGKVKLVEIADVKHNGYNFTDGVGKISRFAAQMIATELSLPTNDPPSVFQIRIGGVKGIVAIAPDVIGNEVHIRKSQYKFPALYHGLEIIRCASFSHVVLNRQLISVLSFLGILDHVFVQKMQAEIQDLEAALCDERLAIRKLRERIDVNQVTLIIARMIEDGFMTAGDPFVLSILQLWRSWITKTLKEKASLSVKNSAFVLGCTDETGTLRGHFDNSGSYSQEAIPQIFIQVDPLRNNEYQVIQGLCIVARNPSLHPGDIRVVLAVDNPSLHHLKNVVVFPQIGDRDIPSMCSGGDLDGDDFVVIWDQELIPDIDRWNVPAMNFKSEAPQPLDRPVQISDVVPFFVQYMKNDSLRTIARSHLACADYFQDGVGDSHCVQLAYLHSIAVDYPKSGVEAKMPQHLRPPQKPHFMATNIRKPRDRFYHSRNVLGQLYDMVKEVDFCPLMHLPFDDRIRRAYPQVMDHPPTNSAVKALKAEYDAALRRIMAQHGIETEFEVWTQFVLQHARLSNDYMFPQELGRIVDSLHERFRDAVYTHCGGRDFSDIAPFVAAMYSYTAQDVALRVQQIRMEKLSMEESNLTKVEMENLPLISFPWLFHRELGMIARGQLPTGSKLRQPAFVAVQQQTQSGPRSGPHEIDIETVEGVTHRGEVLEMFHHPDNNDCTMTENGIRPQNHDNDLMELDGSEVDADDELEDGELVEVMGMNEDAPSVIDRAISMLE